VLHSTIFCMYICITYINVIDGTYNYCCIMKTLVNRLKFGALLTGLLFLSSCTGDATIVSLGGKTADSKEIPVITVKESSSKVKKMSSDLSYSSQSENVQVAVLAKHPVHPNQIKTAMPISFGPSEVILISN
jgi:hypothetical protein